MTLGAKQKPGPTVDELIRFCFVHRTRPGRTAPYPGTRDPDAFIEIQQALSDQGFRYTHTISNYPCKAGAPALPPGLDVHDRSVIALTTRPPINQRNSARRRILTSGTWIETTILGACSQYFALSRRDSIVLTDRVQRAINDIEAEAKASDRRVYMRQRATYRDQGRHSEDADKSPVYLLRLPAIDWNGMPGPGLLVVFGMSALLSYAWAYHLRTRRADLLTGHRFVMAEFTLPETLDTTAAHPEALCGAWDLQVIVDLKLPIPDPSRMKETTRAVSGSPATRRTGRTAKSRRK